MNLLKREDIMGIGVGYYNPKNPEQGAGIILYMNKQTAPSILSIPQNITAQINGKKYTIPSRMVVSDSLVANVANVAKSTSSFKNKIRPVRAGYSVGHSNLSGTAGLIVTNDKKQNQLYICSNNHVLNKNNSNGYTNIIQPGGADGGKSKKDRIGQLDRFVKLLNKWNYLDAATSIPLKNSLLDTRYPTVGSIPVWLRAKDHYATAVNFAGAVDGKISICYPIHWFMQVFKTKVARSSLEKGQVKRMNRKVSSTYTKPLSKNQLSRIKLISI